MFGSFKGAVVPQKTVQTAKPTASAVVEVCIAFRSVTEFARFGKEADSQQGMTCKSSGNCCCRGVVPPHHYKTVHKKHIPTQIIFIPVICSRLTTAETFRISVIPPKRFYSIGSFTPAIFLKKGARKKGIDFSVFSWYNFSYHH